MRNLKDKVIAITGGATGIGFALKDIDIVIHAAALKQVATGEYNPFEAVKTNILGTYELLEVARNYFSNIDNNRKKDFLIFVIDGIGDGETMSIFKKINSLLYYVFNRGFFAIMYFTGKIFCKSRGGLSNTKTF